MMKIQRVKPRCEVEFHTPTAFYSAQGSFDPSDDILSVTTSKSLSSPAGSWSVTLTYRNLGTNLKPETWYDRINPMDLVVIKMGTPPGRLDTVMVGLVDEVRRSRSISADGSPRRQVVINGRDFGKVFLKAMLKFFPQLDNGTLPLELLDGEDTLFGLREFFLGEDFAYGTPAQLIYSGITKILHNLMIFETTVYDPLTRRPKKVTLKEALRFRLSRTNSTIPFINTLAEYEGSFWNFMDSSVNKPFFELFVDTRRSDEIMRMVPTTITEHDSHGVGKFEQTWGEDSSKICLFLRPTPFDKGNWDSIETHAISDDDIINEDLGRSDHENQNMWRVRPAVNVLGTQVYDREVRPTLNIENIRRYGISLFQPDLQGLSAEENSDDWARVIQYGDSLSQKLKDWYWRNIWFENGSISLHGNGKIKVGQRLYNPTEYHNHIYYTESVTQDFVNLQQWTTSVSVTRGQDYVGATQGLSVSVPTELKTYTKAELTAVKSAETNAPSTSQSVQYHTVMSGDTLWGICNKYYHKVTPELIDKIVKANPQIKDPGKIYPGQRFKIPPL